jgi:hypothetical protein
LKLSATLRKELADVSPERKPMRENSGWFKGSKNKEEGVSQ